MEHEVTASNWLERRPEEGRAEETWAVLGLINDGPGVPASIIVLGPVKCIVCDGFAQDQLVCDDCRESVRLVRAAGNIGTLQAVLDFAETPGMLQVLQLLASEDTIAEIMMKRIEDARNRD